MIEFCDLAQVWVLIIKNHKIQPESLELYEEREMRSSILAVQICGMNTKIWMLSVAKNSYLQDQSWSTYKAFIEIL